MNNIKKTPIYGILFLVLSGLIYYLIIRTDISTLASISYKWLLPLFSVMTLFFIFASIPHKLLVTSFGINLSLLETIGLSVLNSFGNYLGPAKAGTIIRATYLKKAHNLKLSSFSSALASYSFLYILSTGLTGCLTLSYFAITNQPFPITLAVISFIVTILPLSALLLPSSLPHTTSRISSFLHGLLQGFSEIKKNHSAIFWSVIFIIFQYIISAIMITLAFRALGFSISFIDASLVGIFTTISNFFTITPNNIGIQEAVMTALGTMLGCEYSEMLSAAVLIRSTHLICTIIFTPILATVLLRPYNIGIKEIFTRNK